METKLDQFLPGHICNELNNFRKNKQTLDFQLKTKSGYTTGIHKLVLLVSSSAVKGRIESILNLVASFEPSIFNRPDVNEFKLDIDINPDNLETLVEYLYTGRLVVTLKNVEILYESSMSLLLSHELRLEKITIEFMIKNIDMHRCLDFWRFGEKFQIKKLFAESLKFFVLNFEKCLDAYISILGEVEIKKIISDERLKVDSEILYQNISKWIKIDLELRKFHLMTLIKNIDFNSFQSEFIDSTIIKDVNIFNCTEFSTFIMKLINRRTAKPIKKTIENSLANVRLGDIYLITETSIDKLDFSCRRLINTYQMHTDEESGVAFSAVATASNKILVTGGKHFINTSCNTSTMILPFANNSIELEPMKVGRSYHSMCCVNYQVYACGGESVPAETSVESFNLERGNWTDQQPFKAKWRFSLVVVENCLYAIGGGNYDGRFENLLVERLDVREKEWEVIAKSETSGFASKSLHINDMIYCFDPEGQGLIFDIRMNKWNGCITKLTTLSRWGTNLSWSSFDIIEYNSSIYGFYGSDVTKTLYEYEYQHDKWIDLRISKELPDRFKTTSLVVMTN